MGFKRWYYDLYLEKFPVISPSGQKYRVVMHDSEFYDLVIKIYIPTNRKRWIKWKKVQERHCFLDSVDGDFVGIAVYEILHYEKQLKEKQIQEEEDMKGIREFEQWDGVIKEVI